MDWLSMNRGVLQGPCSSLGWYEGSEYIPSPDCQDSLKAMERELNSEDLVSRNFRRSLGLSRVIQKDLVPLLVHAKDPGTFSETVRVLVNLTMPVECLLPIHIASRSPSGQETIQQLQQLLLDAKRAFLDDRATTVIVRSIRVTLHQKCDKLSEADCFHINNILILLRNILHMPNGLMVKATGQGFADFQALQNKLIWNLFVQGLDVALLLMINNKHKVFWSVTIVQLIALLFSDQNVIKIQKLLSFISESSDSSEDDIESDTSKTSGRLSGSGSSCDSSKDPVSNGTAASDSGFPEHLGDWSSSHGSSVSRSCSPYCSTPVMVSSPVQSKNSCFDCHSGADSNHRHCVSHYPSLQNTSSSTSLKIEQCRPEDSSCVEKDSVVVSGSSQKDKTENTKNGLKRHKPESTKARAKVVDTSIVEQATKEADYMVTSDLDRSTKFSSSSDEELKHIFSNELNHFEMHNEPAKVKQQHRIVMVENESDSSNDDDDNSKLKSRSHPPVGWKSKGVGDCKYQRCLSSVCLNAAMETASRKGHPTITKEAILEKRRKVCMLADNLAHQPSEEDLSKLLRDFTVNFLHNGFCELVIELKNVISVGSPLVLDKSHFLWLLTYFLRLSNTHSLAYNHVSCILSSDMISYLTFEGVMMCEELELFNQAQQMEIQPLLRRMHLLVTAFRELFSTIDNYCKKPVAKRDRTTFQKLRVQIADMTDVRQLFLLLIRKYNPHLHSKQYLIDIISTNHILMLLLEKVYMDPETCERMDLPAHIKQFGTTKIMEHYGMVLEDYTVNSEFVNDCVFTMMHHVVGESQSIHSLLHPHILKIFCKILEEEFETKEVWEDMMSFVLGEFMRAAQRSPETCMRKLFGLMRVNSEDGSNPGNSRRNSFVSSCSSSSDLTAAPQLSQKDDLLYWWYLQYEHHHDPIGKIQEGLLENHVSRTRKQILKELMSQGIITKCDYDTLTSKETTFMDEDLSEKEDHIKSPEKRDSVLQLVQELIMAGHKPHVDWLQRTLLEVCYVNSELKKTEDQPVKDPVPFYCNETHQSIPLVPYSESQEAVVHTELFTSLLHALGFHMPADVCKVYPRIPSFWTVDVIYSIAQRLGVSCQQKGLKFSLSHLEECLRNTHSLNEESMEEEDEYPVFASPIRGPSRRSSMQKDECCSENVEPLMGPPLRPNHPSLFLRPQKPMFRFPPVVSMPAVKRPSLTSSGMPNIPVPFNPAMNWKILASKSKSFPIRTSEKDDGSLHKIAKLT